MNVGVHVDARLQPDQLEHRATQLSRVCTAWRDSSCVQRIEAVSARARDGMDPTKIATQLDRIARWDAEMLQDLVQIELGTDLTRTVAPRCVLHLASGAVPGLAIDSLIPTLLLGCTHLVRASEHDREIAPFAELLNDVAPDIGQLVTLTDSIDWSVPDAAVVWGTDSTIALVRHKLGQTAPIAAYGERTSLAILHGPDLADADHLSQTLAGLDDDYTRFDGAGCMTPTRLLIVGSVPQSLPAQHADAIARYTPEYAETFDELAALLNQNSARLQTVVIGALGATWDEIAELAVHHGATRICKPGTAHSPSLLAPHDGRGRLRDLVRVVSLE